MEFLKQETRNKTALLHNVWNVHGFAATNPSWFSGDDPFRGDAEEDAGTKSEGTERGGTYEAFRR